MTDKELLELAAKAAGYEYSAQAGYIVVDGIPGNWDPLTDDGDALRLAVDLGIAVHTIGHRSAASASPGQFMEYHNSDKYAATRRAIVRAAAAIGKRCLELS